MHTTAGIICWECYLQALMQESYYLTLVRAHIRTRVRTRDSVSERRSSVKFAPNIITTRARSVSGTDAHARSRDSRADYQSNLTRGF